MGIASSLALLTRNGNAGYLCATHRMACGELAMTKSSWVHHSTSRDDYTGVPRGPLFRLNRMCWTQIRLGPVDAVVLPQTGSGKLKTAIMRLWL
jgi:hypothetical protein